ncbi:MAG: hypothetical protein QOD38_1565 [Acidimicrobiaceae bacterium]
MGSLTEPVALGVTIAIEAPLCAVLGAGITGRRDRNRRAIVGLAVAINIATHPLVWFVLQPTLGVWIAEGLIIGIEAIAIVWLLGIGAAIALPISIVINGASLGAGLLISLRPR